MADDQDEEVVEIEALIARRQAYKEKYPNGPSAVRVGRATFVFHYWGRTGAAYRHTNPSIREGKETVYLIRINLVQLYDESWVAGVDGQGPCAPAESPELAVRDALYNADWQNRALRKHTGIYELITYADALSWFRKNRNKLLMERNQGGAWCMNKSGRLLRNGVEAELPTDIELRPWWRW